jgi:hypothetical protein
LEKSNIIVISRLSTAFEESAAAYIKERISNESIHFYSFHLSLDHAVASVAMARSKGYADFAQLARHKKLLTLHDVDDVSEIRKLVGQIRSVLEKESESVVVLTMRPATTFKIYQGVRAPLYGRVVRIEEPTLQELEIELPGGTDCGYMDLFRAYQHDGLNESEATRNTQSASFNLLRLYWYFLKNDSQKAGSVRVVASCLATHRTPMTISEINARCRIEYGRQAVHAALKTGLMKMTRDKPKKAYIYPQLLNRWIEKNVPFDPTEQMANAQARESRYTP